MSRCRSCGAEIVWALTNTGRRMPVDATPSTIGNLALDYVDGEAHVAVVSDDRGRVLRFRPHFATCPDAQSWRQRTKGGTAA